MRAPAEDTRQWVHVGCVAFAFLLRGLTWWQGALLATTALVFNLFVLPRVGGRRLYRPADEARGFPLGIVLYPVAVLGLILLFRSRLDISAAAWGILALGDGAATLFGRRVGRRAWRWNQHKTVAGTAAFIVCGAGGGILLAWWTRPAVVPEPSLWFVLIAPVAAAIGAAFVETIPVRLDDNISVPAASAAILWLASLMSIRATQDAWPVVVAALPWAVGANAVAAVAGYRARTVSVSGAIGGAAIGIAIYAGAGAAAWLLLLATFLVATVTSRLGLQRKTLLGIAEERGGRRGAGNAIANCGVATMAAIAAVATPHQAAACLALVTALTAGGSDTVASEIGKAWGRSAFLVTSLGRVKHGTPGAVSLEGTAAGLMAAFGLAALGAAFGLIGPSVIPLVVAGATAGALVESALGATLETAGILNNDMLNFVNTAVATSLVLGLA